MQRLASAVVLTRLRTGLGRAPIPAHKVMVRVDRRLDAARHRSLSSVADELCRVPPAHISVDVFDTVLTRRLVGDESLWWLTAVALQADGALRGSPEDFIAARRAASRAGPLDDLQRLYERAPLAAQVVPGPGAQTETRLEAEVVAAVPGAAPALQRLRAAGHRITFVSDMHLSPRALWDSLVRHDVAAEQDHLVVSSDTGRSKSGGELFRWLSSRGDGPGWHVGNDLWADVAMAERAGVRALPVRLAETSRLEQVMASTPGSVGSALAGAARAVRISGGSLAPQSAALLEAGADVAGQCLGAFLLWIRDQSEQAGVQQLCFLARDGELPLRMAQAMPADHWEGLQLTYLHGSRRLWSVAAAAVLGVDEWLRAGCSDDAAFLRQNQHRIPFGSLLARAGLGPDDLGGHAELQALPLEQPLPPSLDPAWRLLLADGSVRARLLARAQAQFRDLREILEAEGVGASRLGIVDVGWRGQLAWQISAVLRAVTGNEPVHLHFGGVGVATDIPGTDIRRFAIDDSRGLLPFPDVISCVETFTASGAARARSTARSEDGRVHLLFDPAIAQMDTEERRLMWRGAVDVARHLPSRAQLARWGLHHDGLDQSVRDVLRALWLSPSRRHALAGSLLSSEVDDSGISVRTVARPYRLSSVRGRAAPSVRTWREGSLRLTPQPLRLVVEQALRQKDARAADT